MTKKYDETSDPLSDLPQHPRGIIGAMCANRLLGAGWQEYDHPHPAFGTLWMTPGATTDACSLFDLETAYKIAFDAWTGLEA